MVSGISSSNSYDLTARLAEMREKYKSMDTDSDGQVSKSEFLTAFQNDQANGTKGKPPAGGPPPGPPPTENNGKSKSAEDIFSEIDSDGDGYISETENETFLNQMEANMQKMVEQYKANSPSLMDYLKSTDESDSSTNSNDMIASFKKDLQALLEKYGQYDQNGTKSGVSTTNLMDYTV
jgi:hypothetical protein